MVFGGCTMRPTRLITFSSTWHCQVQPRLRTEERVQHLISTLQLHFGVKADHWCVHLPRNALTLHCKTLPVLSQLVSRPLREGLLLWLAFETRVLNL